MNSKLFLPYLAETYGDYLKQVDVQPDQVLSLLESRWQNTPHIRFIVDGDSFISYNLEEGSIEDIYVAPAERRCGKGSHLDSRACAELRKAGFTRARGFIEHCNQNKGPIERGLLSCGYKRVGEDAERVIYEKDLM